MTRREGRVVGRRMRRALAAGADVPAERGKRDGRTQEPRGRDEQTHGPRGYKGTHRVHRHDGRRVVRAQAARGSIPARLRRVMERNAA